MPTYEYACDACAHEFEEFQSITAPPLKKCPECGRPRLRRLIGTGAGVLFKGSGFYQTDYRSESYKKAAEAETKSADTKSDSKEAPKSGESKSETKPAASESTARSDSAKSTSSKTEKPSSSRRKKAG